jgi:hypothetical protein
MVLPVYLCIGAEMTLPKRNRRNIYINGVHYHWVKGSRGDNGRGVVTVQLADGDGAKLLIDPFGQIRDHELPDAIRFALDAGWQPTESGAPIWVGFTDSVDLRKRFVLRNASDPPYWICRSGEDKTDD